MNRRNAIQEQSKKNAWNSGILQRGHVRIKENKAAEPLSIRPFVLGIATEAMTPITIIVRDSKENPKKCSILPLKDRPDLQILAYPPKDMPPLDGYLRLSAEGPPLSDADRECGILLLDGSWRSATKMISHFQHVPPRSLSGWKTAYPRVSKLGSDPSNGLASVEALFVAYHILGRSTAGLLDHYHWADVFLGVNNLAKPRDEHGDSHGSSAVSS